MYFKTAVYPWRKDLKSGFAWKQKEPINRDFSRFYRLCVCASGSLI